MKQIKNTLSLILFISLFLLSSVLPATESDSVKNHEEKAVSEEKFDAGKMIIEHITDAHEWHIMEIGETPVTVPLPVILFDDGKPVVFSSSHFHHGKESYNGYRLEHEGANKGKIVKVAADGSISVPLDLSITKNVLSLFIGVLLLCIIFISLGRKYSKNPNVAPKGLQSLLEPIVLFVRDDIAKASLGAKYERYLPYLLTVFFFIFFVNLLGLIPFFPGGANVTGNVAVTLVLAVFTFLITTFSAKKSYWLHIINTPGVPWWLKFPLPLMPIVEIIGVITKPFVLMVRLFANMLAGHIIILGFVSLIFIFAFYGTGVGYGVSVLSMVFAVFMGLLEMLVAFLQAYVFTLLSSLYFAMATEEHEHKEAH